MAEKWFIKHLLILWLGIASTRVVMQLCVSNGLMSPLALNIGYVMFVLCIFGCEIVILKNAARRFAESPGPPRTYTVFDSAPAVIWRIRNLKFLTGLMMFCLPIALLELRANRESILPSLIGAGANLLFTYRWASTLFRLKNRTNLSTSKR